MYKPIGCLSLGTLFLALLAFSFAGCEGTAPVKSVSVMDNPDHHYNNGMKFLDKGEYENALVEFERARALNPKYGKAYLGIGLVKGHKGNFDAAFEAMKQAKDLDGVYAQVGMIRLYSMQRAEGWLGKAEDEFESGKKKDGSSGELYFYMGRAYKVAFEFDKASACFQKVLDLKKDLVAEANQEWALLQKIQRASPGTRIGKQIALIDKITRSDVAALFIEELNLEKLFKSAPAKEHDAFFKALEGKSMGADRVMKAPLAIDIANHPLKADIDAVIALGVRGLETFPDRTFAPGMVVSRANYAMMVEDVLIKVSGDEKLATQFIGDPSPFPDVRTDHYAFNAIMVCTTRGLMEARLDGYFGLEEPVSGADALLVIRRMKEELKY
ncbi:MAG: S-layer homology domain-containing protein [candidate division NC10 bacterium]|nr:S-layer homology domain-containing protein [candidate division NC10 bacterium]